MLSVDLLCIQITLVGAKRQCTFLFSFKKNKNNVLLFLIKFIKMM